MASPGKGEARRNYSGPRPYMNLSPFASCSIGHHRAALRLDYVQIPRILRLLQQSGVTAGSD
jgi:hypothetical protein